MNQKMFATILSLILNFGNMFSQNLKVNWSEPILSDNKLNGFFSAFQGYNSNFIYVKYSNLALKRKKQNRKIVIKGLDKETMKEKFSETIVDFDDRGDKENYSGMQFYKTAIFDNVIYMFWKNNTRDVEELYVRTLDIKCKPISKLKKIYELKKEKAPGAKQPEIFVLSNEKAGNNLIIGGELAALNGQTLKIEYKLMKSDLSFIQASQIELPVSKAGRAFDGFSCTYEYGQGGKLFIYSHIIPTKDERRELKKDGNVLAGYFDIISCVDLNDGRINSFTLKFDKKYIHSYKAITDKNSLKVTGFFCDLNKDEKGKDNHGLFYVMLDDKDLKVTSSKFSYFNPEQLNELFALDKQEGKDKAGIFTSKKKKQSENESISSLYNIEEIIISPDGDLVLFGSRMMNYSRTVCSSSPNGGRSCQTSYYCQKDNVTAFKLSTAGDLIWAKNLDRRKTYGRWNVYDLSIVSNMDRYYVIYGSDFEAKAVKKNYRSSKSKKQSIDRLEYAIFDGKDGSVAKSEEIINKINAKKEERKFIDPANIHVINNNFYIPSEKKKFKPARLVLNIAATVVLFPVGIIMFMSPNNYKANGFIGKISPR